jgi:hypothetical protein
MAPGPSAAATDQAPLPTPLQRPGPGPESAAGHVRACHCRGARPAQLEIARPGKAGQGAAAPGPAGLSAGGPLQWGCTVTIWEFGK